MVFNIPEPFQIPNYNFQIPNKLQAPISDDEANLENWDLGHWYLFVIWYLVFGAYP